MADGKPEGMNEKVIGWLIIFVILAVIAYIFYVLYTPQILNFFRWFRYGEMWLVSLVTPDSYKVILAGGQEVNLKDWMESTAAIPAEKLTFGLVVAMTAVALIPYKWPILVVIGAIGLWAYQKGPGTDFIEVFNLDGFLKFQSKAFPVIQPFVNFNPSNQPPRAPGDPVPAELPLFAEALGPEEWLAYNEIPIKDDKFDEGMLFKKFALQLGPRWNGVKRLKPYKQVLLAAFCLKASRKRDEADDMLGRLAVCWSHDKGLKLSLDRSLVRDARKVLANKDLSHETLKKCKQHGWQTTAMLRALLNARDQGGVLAPAQFVWLRGYDRNLWYALNNLGRQSNHIEAVGAMAHFRLERRAKRPIPRPKVQEAVNVIVEYMESDQARPIPKLDYSYSKNKRGVKKLKTA